MFSGLLPLLCLMVGMFCVLGAVLKVADLLQYVSRSVLVGYISGAAVLIVSTELDEVMALADRLLVMFDGHIVAELDPTTVTNADVGLYMAGATP